MKKLWWEAESSYEFWQIFVIAGKKPQWEHVWQTDRPTSTSTAPYVTHQQTNKQTSHRDSKKRITLPTVEGYRYEVKSQAKQLRIGPLSDTHVGE